MKRTICTILLLSSIVFTVVGCGNKTMKESEESKEQETVIEETTETTTVKTMQAEESVTITIDENSEGTLTPNE